MAAVANNPAFAKKAGVPQSVGKDFNDADKGRKFSRGGDTMATKDSGFDDDVKNVKRNLYMDKSDDNVYSRVRNPGPSMARRRLEERGVDTKGMIGNRANPDDLGSYKKGGDVKESKEMMKKEVGFMKKAGAPKSMIKHEMAEAKGKPFAKGGGISSSLKAHASAPASKAHAGMKSGGMAKFSKGGVTRADGCVTKGHTKGTMVKMAMGGKTC
jgi:hypothetical protein